MNDPSRPESGSQSQAEGEGEPSDTLTASVTDGRTVDWSRAESVARDAADKARVRGLRDLAQIAEHHRRLQRSPASSGGAERGAGAMPSTGPEQWGNLTLLELVSAGASGEVWRAWDVWLEREVALKFLLTVHGPEAGEAEDAKLLDEARVLARVRHTGVVALYGIAEHDGRVGMWMELLRGHTLEMEIERRGGLPPREVVRIGLELCRALEAVESAGLVHRDIKPANIVLDTGGRTVLTDFGLGRRLALANQVVWGSSGTPLFMSPELLAGEPATARSDLYALGVTLRWALTGQPPFRARNLEELLVEAAAGPSTKLSAERPDVPLSLIQPIERAMAPQVEARYASATQFAEALESALRDMSTKGSRARRRRRRTAFATAVIALLGIGTATFPRFLGRRTEPLPARFTLAAPPNTTLVANAIFMAISPNGRLLAFTAADSIGARRLWVRPLDAHAATRLEGTESAELPFWSPDSRQLGFFADAKLKKISVDGGRPEVLCDAPNSRGASWGRNGVIVFAPVVTGPLCRISAEGGEITEIQRPDSSRGETALRWPQFLPDGEHFLFVSLPPRDGNFEVFAASIDSKERQHVMLSGAAPLCAGKDGLIVASNGRLMSQRFDYRRLKPVGEPASLGAAASADLSVGQPLASVSTNGVLVQPAATLANTELVWLDRSGRRQGALPLPKGRYENTFFSPDGRRILAERRTSPTNVDLWMIQRDEGQAIRFSHGTQSRSGGISVWSPDGDRIAFNSNRGGTTNIYQRLTNGAGEEELLYESGGQFKEVVAWTRDGRFLVFQQADPITSWDLWLLPLQGEREPIPYLRTRFGEIGGSLSPDGGWMAYTSDATGRDEIYVGSFPEPGGEQRITNAGGDYCVWSTDGDEVLIFNWNIDHSVWSVPVSTVPTFKAGTPRFLFRSRADELWLTVTPDGNRFLQSIPAEGAEPATIAVDLNWPAQLGR